jgi:predicted site-specific integrase-resolvase
MESTTRRDYRHNEIDPRMLTPRQVTERFGIAEQTLANWRTAGKGPRWSKVGAVGRPGGFVYYDPDDVQMYLQDRSQVVTVDPAA